jgi:hypothetical protein
LKITSQKKAGHAEEQGADEQETAYRQAGKEKRISNKEQGIKNVEV